MIIIDLSSLESDFCKQATKNTGARQVRSMDIDTEYSMFVYYFTDYIHISLGRYDDKDMDKQVWEALADVGTLYPDVDLSRLDDIWINEEKQQLHVKLTYEDVETWIKKDD